jgi:hypothetical protein
LSNPCGGLKNGPVDLPGRDSEDYFPAFHGGADGGADVERGTGEYFAHTTCSAQPESEPPTFRLHHTMSA